MAFIKLKRTVIFNKEFLFFSAHYVGILTQCRLYELSSLLHFLLVAPNNTIYE